eukprot:07448.XXX_349048_349155_1 [CDS] Oithona nana genome sequencing.
MALEKLGIKGLAPKLKEGILERFSLALLNGSTPTD